MRGFCQKYSTSNRSPSVSLSCDAQSDLTQLNLLERSVLINPSPCGSPSWTSTLTGRLEHQVHINDKLRQQVGPGLCAVTNDLTDLILAIL